MLILIAVVAIFYGYNIFSWSEYPDFGYGFRTATGIEVVGTVTENGRRAGLAVGDRIIEVNGRPFGSIQEFRSHMHRSPGEMNQYLVEREGRRFSVTIENVPIGLREAFLGSGFLFLLGLCYVFIGTVVFLMKPHSRTSWVFLLFTGTLGVWMFFLYKIGKMSPFWLETVQILAYCFTPAVFVHLAFSFPEERRLLRDHPFGQAVPYVLSLVLFVAIRSRTAAMTDAPKPLLIAVVVYMALAIFLYLGSNVQLRLTSTSELVKSRSKMILLGSAIATLVPLVDFISSVFFRVYLLPQLQLLPAVFHFLSASVGYAIVKHDLFDIDAIIKRTYGYVLTTGALAGDLRRFWCWLPTWPSAAPSSRARRPFAIVFILAVVFLFNPVRDRVQRFIDRVFYRLEYDYQATVQKISETMRSLLEPGPDRPNAIMDTALGPCSSTTATCCCSSRDGAELRLPGGGGSGRDGRPEAVAGAGEAREPDRSKPAACGPEVAGAEAPGRGAAAAEDGRDRQGGDGLRHRGGPGLRGQPGGLPADLRDTCRRQLLVPLIYEDRLTGLIALGPQEVGQVLPPRGHQPAQTCSPTRARWRSRTRAWWRR